MKALALILVAGAAQAEAPWVGTWGADGCDQPVTYSEQAISSESSFCEVTSMEEMASVSAWRVDLACDHGGDVYSQSRVLMWSQGEGRLWSWIAGTEPGELVRCD